MFIANNSEALKQMSFIVGSGGVSAGDLVTLSSAKVIASTTADTDIIGVAQEDGDEDDVVAVELAENNLIEADYTGTFADADIGSSFDLADAQTVDQGTTANGDVMLMNYDADTAKCWILIPLSHRAL